jgi:transposase
MNEDQKIHRARTLARKGVNRADIAKDVGVGIQTITKWCRHIHRASCSSKQPVFSQIEDWEIYQLRRNGMSYRAITEHMGKGTADSVANAYNRQNARITTLH